MTTLDNLRKHAKRWLKALRAGDPDARARLARAYQAAADPPTLRDVQHALARERGYENWTAMTTAAAIAPAAAPLTRLLEAAGKGEVVAVNAILDSHPGIVNHRGTLPGNSGLRTALHFGVGHRPVVEALLARGADPNIRDEGDNAYPIHFAAERGDLAIVQLLVEHGADPVGDGTAHELDVVGWAVCFDYAMHVEVARYLLAHGARYTIFTATALGEADAIRRLAASGADVNRRMDRTNHRRTPLHLAVVKKQPQALAALIEAGADLNAEDAVGLTPLDQAALGGDEAIVRLLIDAGASMTLPAAIVLERDADVDRILRDNPERFSTTDNRGWARLLVHASSRASAPTIERLLRALMRHRAGLSIVNMMDDEETAVDGASGYTALHSAAFHGNTEVVRLLLAVGANVRARDRTYCATPAGWAAYAGHQETANVILDADIDLFDAINFDRADLVGRILDHDPASIDRPFRAYASCPSREGQSWPAPDCTPLEWATARGKARARQALVERGAGARTPSDIERAARIVTFLQSACWDHTVHGKSDHRMYDRAAQRILAADPSIARESLYTAIVCGDLQEAERRLAADPASARERGGARGWTPILYLAYTRFTHGPTLDHALAIARLLLDRGADPNDFYMAGDSRYTALVGAAGEGEQDSPRQPYAESLFDLLLERGAEPFDIQVLYDTHFSGDMLWWLELVYTRTIDTPRGAVWNDPLWPMFDMGGYGSGARFILWTAITRRKPALAAWVLAHGATPNAPPARGKRMPKCSLYDLALREGAPEIAELLAEYGADGSRSALDDPERFLDACCRLDRGEAERLLRAHPDYLKEPHVLFTAAKQNRPDVLALLLALGFPLEMEGSGGHRALHEAAANHALDAARFLIERGAEIDPHDHVYDSPPIGWALHSDHREMIDFLSRYSRDVWRLAFTGKVDRLREVLEQDPKLARITAADGHTPLWWLPDDDEKAMAVVELLLAAGADASAKTRSGRTAADWARERGMYDIAARLDVAARPR